MRRLWTAALAVLAAARVVAADDQALSGQEVYAGACASCHGDDGHGAPQGTALEVPLPDFTDCGFITREGDGNWRFLLAHGGDALGLSPQMPAFGDVLTAPQIQSVLDYIRSFCPDSRWPRGDLNFRRLLVTDKAFPEDEVVLTQEFEKGRDGVRDWATELSVEHRLGARGQVELAVPVVAHDVTDGGATTGGVGDMTLAFKQALIADFPSRSIVAAAVDLGLPTGDRDRGLGAGTVSFGPSLLAGKQIRDVVIQGQILGELPIDEHRADRAVHYRFALSYPLSEVKRAWVPSVEMEVLQNVSAKQQHLFITPEVYKGITQRGHLAIAIGAQLPVAGDADPFDYRLLAFFLWDYADGGLWW